jgi:hypothetical protein
LNKYQAGECVEVYDSLLADNTDPGEGLLVAREMINRVRRNLECLVDRWRQSGFFLTNPIGEKGLANDALNRIEERYGLLPAVLRAFYENLGWVNFVEEAPGPPWPGIEELDPISFKDITRSVDEVIEEGEAELILFPDHLLKFGIAGVGPVTVPIGTNGFDVALLFEDGSMSFEKDTRMYSAGDDITLVRYLRDTILLRGGMGSFGTPTEELDPDLLRSLTEGLEVF